MYKKASGFTIVELLIVIVAIAIIATIAIVGFSQLRVRAIDSSVATDARNSAQVLEVEKQTNGTYPADASTTNGGKGLPVSGANTYSYVVDSTGNSYTLTITNSSITYSYQVSSTDQSVKKVAGQPPVIVYSDADSSGTTIYNGGCGPGYLTASLNSYVKTTSVLPMVSWQHLSAKNTQSGTWVNVPGNATYVSTSGLGYYFHHTYAPPAIVENDYMMFRAIADDGTYQAVKNPVKIIFDNGC